MSPAEALQICRVAKALSPAQAVDDYTPDAWAIVLRNVRYQDAQAALEELGGEQEWIHVSHIVKRVKRIRAARLTGCLFPNPPHPMEPDEYRHWLHETRRSIADGTHSPESVVAGTLEGPTTPERRAALRAAARSVEEV